jgi:3-oxoacyl-(acyl-carrier-protein) synthase
LSTERIAITGMAINTPLGDTLSGYLDGLLAGRSAVTRWKTLETDRIYSKVGADLSEYDIPAKVSDLQQRAPAEVGKRLKRLVRQSPWSTRLTMLLALEAWMDAGFDRAPPDPTRTASIIAGHNINLNHQYANRQTFVEEPDYMDPMLALTGLDTDHAGCVSELLGVVGPIYTIGSACASANHALRCAIDEIRHHDMEAALVTGAVLDFSPIELHAMAIMGAIAFQSFNDEPARASRPYDTKREGFVPAHGGGTLVLEPMDRAIARGARIYAEVLGCEANSDGNHLPQPSAEGQARLMRRVLERCKVDPTEIDYISAHATSTPLGDVTELQSIHDVFGPHAYKLKVNATKSMLGHTCWAAPVVESIAAILQMNAGKLHPSINIDELDPAVDIDVCRGRVVEADIRTVMKNSFGFGGINCISLLRKVPQ